MPYHRVSGTDPEQVAASMRAHMAPLARFALRDVIDALGGPGRRGVMAALGLTDPKSHEYKAMQRNLQRYVRGERAPNAETARRLADAANRRGLSVTAADLQRRPGERPRGGAGAAEQLPRRGTLLVSITGTITISTDTRTRTVEVEASPDDFGYALGAPLGFWSDAFSEQARIPVEVELADVSDVTMVYAE